VLNAREHVIVRVVQPNSVPVPEVFLITGRRTRSCRLARCSGCAAVALVPNPFSLVLDELRVAMDDDMRREFGTSRREFAAGGSPGWATWFAKVQSISQAAKGIEPADRPSKGHPHDTKTSRPQSQWSWPRLVVAARVPSCRKQSHPIRAMRAHPAGGDARVVNSWIAADECRGTRHVRQHPPRGRTTELGSGADSDGNGRHYHMLLCTTGVCSRRPEGHSSPSAAPTLTVYNDNLNANIAGATYSGLDIHGFVNIEAPNVTIKDSIIRGGVSHGDIGLVQDISNTATNFLLEDPEMVPS